MRKVLRSLAVKLRERIRELLGINNKSHIRFPDNFSVIQTGDKEDERR